MRRQLLRWSGWFAAANAGLFLLVGLRFLMSYPLPADGLGISYMVLASIGHFALLASLPVALLVVPLALLSGWRMAVTTLGVVLMSAALTLLVVDANVFASQRYHLTPLTAMLFESDTWLLVGLIGLVALVFESLLAVGVWRWIGAAPARGGRLLAVLLAGCWLASQGIHIWADAVGILSVTQLTRHLPAYFPIHAKRSLARWGLVDPEMIERRRSLEKVAAGGGGQLNYPLKPLSCNRPARPPNILVVLVDALRPDAVHRDLTPSIAALADEGETFANHWSGGNSSKAGIFSLFYSLPSTYLETFYGVQQPPVLMQELRRQGYRFALFSAPGFGTPTDIERTVFAGFPGLPGERHDLSAVARNRAVTDDWHAWLAGYDATQPFFGFLYYDPPMGEMSADPSEPLPMDERFTANPQAQENWRRYRRSARMVDGEVGRVVASLRERQLLDETILIVLSDHGYEFDDNGLGYLGHAKNYSAAQLRATLIMRWPGRTPATFSHRSSHYDLPVTLLQDALGCVNDPPDYALGRNLFAGEDWPWLIAGSYNSHAILAGAQTVVTHPGGFVEILGSDYRPVPGAEVDIRVVEAALGDMRRFYR